MQSMQAEFQLATCFGRKLLGTKVKRMLERNNCQSEMDREREKIEVEAQVV